MNQDDVKKLLLSIEDTQLDFSVTFTGKASKKVNGLYKPQTLEILLHNKNFSADNQLVYTAIHEYAHHLQNEKNHGLRCSCKVHTNDFWTLFHRLLEKAEAQGLYGIGLESSPELAQLTQEIRKNFLEQNGKLMIEFGKILVRAHQLCVDAHIRYEDYIDRVLCFPRNTAKSITKLATLDLNPSVGFENMKILASVSSDEKRSEVEKHMLSGKSPDSIRSIIKNRSQEADPKELLQKEKSRLEKTIISLQSRLETVEKNLASL